MVGRYLYAQPSGTANEREREREWGGGGYEPQHTSDVSKYGLTSATNCSLRSSSDGSPTSGALVWRTVMRTKVQLVGPHNRHEPKEKKRSHVCWLWRVGRELRNTREGELDRDKILRDRARVRAMTEVYRVNYRGYLTTRRRNKCTNE